MGKGSKSKKRVTKKKVQSKKNQQITRNQQAERALNSLLITKYLLGLNSQRRTSMEKDAELLRRLSQTGGKKNKTQKKRKNKSNKK